MKPYLYK